MSLTSALSEQCVVLSLCTVVYSSTWFTAAVTKLASPILTLPILCTRFRPLSIVVTRRARHGRRRRARVGRKGHGRRRRRSRRIAIGVAEERHGHGARRRRADGGRGGSEVDRRRARREEPRQAERHAERAAEADGERRVVLGRDAQAVGGPAEVEAREAEEADGVLRRRVGGAQHREGGGEDEAGGGGGRAAQARLRPRRRARGLPERQRRVEQQQAGQVDGERREQSAERAVGVAAQAVTRSTQRASAATTAAAEAVRRSRGFDPSMNRLRAMVRVRVTCRGRRRG